ncbi:MAG: cytochrome-c oxidase, cbb3-type subunit I [Oligoflexia bacterium]|nr:cytochrome-c oxidase, cbb3-type subunit I [Oligoflexia bacterium]
MNSTVNKYDFYDDEIVKKFVIATVCWGLIAFLVGLVVALQLADWRFNFGLPWITFGRLRPLHTNAAIFAFAGNAIFAGIYHSSQRLLKARLSSDLLSNLHFWGWQLIIVSAALTLPFGYTTSKEYAELEWPIDIAITIVWVIFAVNFFLTIKNRKEQHIYVAIWFYIATIITVAVLHIVNSIAIPVTFLKSYPVYAGVQDALVQWWYGHNAVAFVLTTPFLGLMYYYIPKAVNRPVYSYRLSIIHFWSLVFIYIWAGPHHLLHTSLPNWAQSLGMVFSLMLWAPSWGGMINGLLTLRGAWDKIRTDPVVKFLIAAVTFYGMATFEGPLLSIKSVNSLAHYTDWIIGHVHAGALGWNGFLTFGMLYYLVPKLWKTNLYSVKLATTHFWIGLLGIILYIMAMWASGITQGLMWQAMDDSGNLLYPDFVETVIRLVPLYYVRFVGGLLFLLGFLIQIFNLTATVLQANKEKVKDPVAKGSRIPFKDVISESSHRSLEGLPAVFSTLVVIAVLVASAFSLIPALFTPTKMSAKSIIRPYSPLELVGRDVYIREGCYLCHSQQIRTMSSEVLRYGPASTMEESIFDHPFQWGSKRTGPDLARIGKKYPDLWHYRHMMDPREVTPKSLMPAYAWLAKDKISFDLIPKKLRIMQQLGVPYSEYEIDNSIETAQMQAATIAKELHEHGAPSGLEKTEMVALIAYLQSLGQMSIKPLEVK